VWDSCGGMKGIVPWSEASARGKEIKGNCGGLGIHSTGKGNKAWVLLKRLRPDQNSRSAREKAGITPLVGGSRGFLNYIEKGA